MSRGRCNTALVSLQNTQATLTFTALVVFACAVLAHAAGTSATSGGSSSSTPVLLNILWHPLAVLRGSDAAGATTIGHPGSPSLGGSHPPRTILGTATSFLREGASETLDGLVDLRRTVETTGRDALLQEATYLTGEANRAVAFASTALGSRVTNAAATAAKQLEEASNIVEQRLEQAALGTFTRLKAEAERALTLTGAGADPAALASPAARRAAFASETALSSAVVDDDLQGAGFLFPLKLFGTTNTRGNLSEFPPRRLLAKALATARFGKDT